MARTAMFGGLLVVGVMWACGGPTDGPVANDGSGSASPGSVSPSDPGQPGGPGTTPGETGPTDPAPAPPSTFTCEGRAGAKGDRTLTMTAAGGERTVLLHVPPSYDPKKGTSLVIGFHGYGGSA